MSKINVVQDQMQFSNDMAQKLKASVGKFTDKNGYQLYDIMRFVTNTLVKS